MTDTLTRERREELIERINGWLRRDPVSRLDDGDHRDLLTALRRLGEAEAKLGATRGVLEDIAAGVMTPDVAKRKAALMRDHLAEQPATEGAAP